MLSLFNNFTKRIGTFINADPYNDLIEIDENAIMRNKNQQYLLKLLSLVDNQEGFSGAVKLVKAIFLVQYESLQRGTSNTFDYKFYRWDYGPFDSSIYSDLRSLSAQQLIEVNENDYGNFSEKKYSITPKGKEKLKEIFANSTDDSDELLKKIVNDVNSSSRAEILKRVYELADVYSYEMGDVIRLKKPQPLS